MLHDHQNFEGQDKHRIDVPYKSYTTYDERRDGLSQNTPISGIPLVILAVPVVESRTRMAPASTWGSQLGRHFHLCAAYSQRLKQMKKISQRIGMETLREVVQYIDTLTLSQEIGKVARKGQRE